MSILNSLLKLLLLFIFSGTVSPPLYSQLVTVSTNGKVVSKMKVDYKPPAVYADAGRQEEAVYSKKREQEDLIVYTPKIFLPLGTIKPTSPYGARFHPVFKETKFHAGIDLKANYEPVYAIAAGEVEKTGFDNRSGFYIVIKHGSNLKTVYAHLSYIGVTKGQRVNGNSLVALSGNTGTSTAPHLHFAVNYKNKSVDPGIVLKLF